MVSLFRHLVGLSCEGHEQELLRLFAALERDREQSCHKSPGGNDDKFSRELKGLVSSINYDGRTSTVRQGRSEGRALLKNK
ncbi:hypothetical protein CJ030_MR7G014283 [Morella rubra]|uniref:Uncharacterized protein n=1 Tax=Morella rubra TaxID=262757 RepID=A0A6A1V2A4_9ROSI|nr:hypothetical protein CJ030_MR7G014283 [Morella rubra]